MMNIYETLKNLRFIKPDEGYSARSRNVITSMIQDTPRPRITLWQFVLQNIQLGSAIALTGLLLLLGFGGFSAWKSFSPFGINSLDPANLRAEADAVKDIEVALNSVEYMQPTATSQSPTFRSAQPIAQTKKSAPTASSSAKEEPTATMLAAPNAGNESDTSTSTAISSSSEAAASITTVDEALDLLIE